MKILDNHLQLLADFAASSIESWNLVGRESPVCRLVSERTVSNVKLKYTLDWEIPDRLKEAVQEIAAAERDSAGSPLEA